MICPQTGAIECDTVQIIEPKGDFLVDTGGVSSDLDERGSVELLNGQTSVAVLFDVTKINASYNFEYLYVDAVGLVHPGAIQVIPTLKAAQGFTVLFAGAPIGAGYVLHWRVTIVRTSSIAAIDAPEDLYLQMPRTTTMAVAFVNPRSGVNYGFSELRVENLLDLIGNQAIINVQVHQKTETGFVIGVSPRPPTDNYFLKVRTP
jgi:hypothetical protein